MPSFSPFKSFKLFPEPPIQQSVKWGALYSETVSNSSINNIVSSVPVWWLLYKIEFSVYLSQTMFSPPNGPSGSGTVSFDLKFTIEENPFDKICRQGDFLGPNVINVTGDVENVEGTGDFVKDGRDPNPFNPDSVNCILQPFACEKLNVNFGGEGNALSSTIIGVVVTSNQNQFGLWDNSQNDNLHNAYSGSINITPPNSDEVELSAYINLFGDGNWNANGNIELKNVEWWTL